MTQHDLDLLLDALDALYPGRFTDLGTSELRLWRKALGDAPLDAALAAVERWYRQHLRQYVPTLETLGEAVAAIRREDAQALARLRTANAHWSASQDAASLLGAQDANTALYGQLLGVLAQRSLAQRLTPDDLAAQCQVWAGEYPAIAAPLQRAARLFVGEGSGTLH